MVGAATKFASLPELLYCLAEQIHSHSELDKLRLVNKAFSAAATVFRFREHKLSQSTARFQLHYIEAGHLRHVRTLWVGSAWEEHRHNDYYYNILGMMLPEMPHLETLRWKGDQRFLRLEPPILEYVRGLCPALRALHIAFPDVNRLMVNEDGVFDRVGFADVVGHAPSAGALSGLEALTLDNLCEELPWWRDHLVQVLRNSPGLRSLQLSLAPFAVMRSAYRQNWLDYDGFFDRLCDAYGATGAPPLRLRSLHLGYAMFPRNVDSVQRLVGLASLEEVHVENKELPLREPPLPEGWDDVRGPRPAYDCFGPAHCPSLRRYTFHDCDKGAFAFLARTDAAWLRNVALSCRFECAGWELAGLLRADPRLPALPLHPRMLHIQLHRDCVSLVARDKNALMDRADVPTAEQVLDDLVAGDGGALEGLAVGLDPFRWRESLDQLVEAVGKLANLTQLAVLDGRMTDPDPIMYERVARQLAAAAPRLRYVKLHKLSWRVWRVAGGIRLEYLSYPEDYQFELIRVINWVGLQRVLRVY